VLGAFDLVVLGIGGVIGAGVFVLTGVAARQFAGPAVVLSYMISAFASLLAALCYTEFAVELPVAGSAYNYIAVVYGELPAFLVGCDLVLEFTISAAAVARGWTSYAATMVGLNSEALRFGPPAVRIDLLAFALIMAQSGLLCWGIKESSNFNIVINAVNLACIGFVLLVGGSKVERANWHPWAPNGVTGIFAASSIVFFSFVGFDTVATAAEEVRNPGRDLPLGIIGSLVICTALYAGMCLVITGMVPSSEIDLDAPFAAAFATRGMEWAAGIVSAGALTGITTSLLVSLLGQPRIYMTMSRDGLLPLFFGRIHPTRGTPVNAQLFTGVTAGLMAMLVNIDALAQLVRCVPCLHFTSAPLLTPATRTASGRCASFALCAAPSLRGATRPSIAARTRRLPGARCCCASPAWPRPGCCSPSAPSCWARRRWLCLWFWLCHWPSPSASAFSPSPASPS
jgi:APA family basic amino acid/polyamine antiporter